MSPPPIPAGDWELDGTTLVPTGAHLRAHCTRLATQPPEDPLLTLHFISPNSTTSPPSLTAHRSHLHAAGGLLATLASSPTRTLPLDATPDALDLLRRYLYCAPLPLAPAPPELAALARYLALPGLADAVLLAALPRALSAADLLIEFLPVLTAHEGAPPQPFVACVALAVARDFRLLVHLFAPPPPYSPRKRRRLSAEPELDLDYKPDPPPDCKPPLPPDCKPDRSGSPVTPAPRATPEELEYLLPSDPAPCPKGMQSPTPKSSGEDIPVMIGPPPCDAASDATAHTWVLEGRDVWHAFREHGMLPEIIQRVARFAPGDHTPLLLDVVLRHLEPHLLDDDIHELLTAFDWGSAACAAALDAPATAAWPKRAWRLLTLAQARYMRDAGHVIRMSWHVNGLVQSARDALCWYQDCPDFWDYRQCTDCSMSLHWSSDVVARPAPLVLRVQVRDNVEYLPIHLLQHKVRVDVEVSGDGCACGDGHRRFCPEPMGGPGGDHFTIRSIGAITPVEGAGFVVMGGDEFRRWLQRHNDTCGLVFSVRLQFEKSDFRETWEDERKDINAGSKRECRAKRREADSNRYLQYLEDMKEGKPPQPMSCTCGLCK